MGRDETIVSWKRAGRRLLAPRLAVPAIAMVLAGPMAAAEDAPFRLGVTAFLSGPGAGPFGEPAAQAARLVVDAINQGALPAPYDTVGFAGRPVEIVLVDEAGGPVKQISELRAMVERRGVEAIAGYVSSSSCLAVAPVADELRIPTVLWQCGTPRVFEEARYRYVFRTKAHGTTDAVAAARYVIDQFPEARHYAGVNPNYAWGHDSWRDFTGALAALAPAMTTVGNQFPQLFAGQFNAEITATLLARPDVVMTSLWGRDLESFVLQAAGRGLDRQSVILATTGETLLHGRETGPRLPEGLIVGGRGMNGFLAPDTALGRWLTAQYVARYQARPPYPAFDVSTAILALKIAVDTAARAGPVTAEAIAAALTYLSFESFNGPITLSLSGGHQAVTDHAYGRLRYDPATGAPYLEDIRRYPAACVSPPAAMTSAAWLAAGVPTPDCPPEYR